MGIVDKVRSVGLGIIIWVLAIPISIFTILPLISSLTPGVSNIYLVAVKMDKDDWLRIGYYGFCRVSEKKTVCTTTSARSAKAIANTLNLYPDAVRDPLRLQRDVFVAFLTAGGVVWLISLILITHVIIRGHRSGRLVRSGAKTFAMAAATLMIASAWATNSAAKALEVITEGHGFRGGILLYALQWIGAIVAFFYAWAVTSVADHEDKSFNYHI